MNARPTAATYECYPYFGSARTPKVRALLEKFFGKPVNTKLNPDEAVPS